MEKKLMEKKAVLDIIEAMLNGIDSWTVERRQEKIDNWERLKKASAEAGEEVDPNCWNAREAQEAREWFNALETVKKHLEKLI